MFKRNAQPLSQALSEFFDKNSSLREKLAEHKVVKGWREVLGEGVSHYTKQVYFKRRILYVQLTSSVLRAELLMNKENLIKKMNDYAGMPIVQDIIIR